MSIALDPLTNTDGSLTLKYRDIQPAETEHMLQIWHVLKSLLLEHSALRQTQRQGPEGHAGMAFTSYTHSSRILNFHTEKNVVGFMKRGLGDIQQYFTGLNDTRDPFWDGPSIDGFFEAACIEWQDN